MRANDEIKIMIADDHPLIRRGLRNIFESTPQMTVVAEARDGEEVVEKVRDYDVDVLVLDISMPRKNGLEVLREVKQEFPELPVLVLSLHTENHLISLARKRGAAAYLTKGVEPETLVSTVREIATAANA